MPIKDVFKISRKTFFYPTGWLGAGLIKTQFKTTYALARNIFVPVTAKRQETFAEAVERLQLTEADLKQASLRYILYTLLFGMVGAALVCYAGYLLIHHDSFAGFLVGLAVAALALVNAFRFHFLYYQIRHRKLGCSLQEYLSGKTIDSGGAQP